MREIKCDVEIFLVRMLDVNVHTRRSSSRSITIKNSDSDRIVNIQKISCSV
jgi:hypothetical protein